MRVSRTESLKRDAERVARWMTKARMKKVRIVGARGFWTIIASGTARQLAAFAAREARYYLDSELASL